MSLFLSVRQRVVALVAGLGTLGGFLAGATGALLAVSTLTPASPVSVATKGAMILAYGSLAGAAGAVLGTGVAFAMLRGVRLGRAFAFGTLGAAAGLAYGFVGGPWAWHHLPWLGVGGLVAGALAARLSGPDVGEAGAEGRLASWVMGRAGIRGGGAALEAGPMAPLDPLKSAASRAQV